MSINKQYHGMTGVRVVAFIRRFPYRNAIEIFHTLKTGRKRTYMILLALSDDNFVSRKKVDGQFVYYMTNSQFERFQDSLLEDIDPDRN